MTTNTHTVTGCGDCPYSEYLEVDECSECQHPNAFKLRFDLAGYDGPNKKECYTKPYESDVFYYHPDCPLKSGPITVKLEE